MSRPLTLADHIVADSERRHSGPNAHSYALGMMMALFDNLVRDVETGEAKETLERWRREYAPAAAELAT